ncbi:hypothetical protein [uncultured Gammaproteobacteria bacterium]|nr:hypothetical protein BROOK1789C_1795 [Bathymodiolus brooksi thiotrophic gill symbiont]CAC9623236.1 hypothetical protein [uncultured Gammaproteobacteria bacterium]CAC9962344.1 hypothetical protein [uncultured Gammaproteobacteria bacterium]CAC9963732.1 hypothetical protein [uncultured Gammaproteobacteria bacterium]
MINIISIKFLYFIWHLPRLGYNKNLKSNQKIQLLAVA